MYIIMDLSLNLGLRFEILEQVYHTPTVLGKVICEVERRRTFQREIEQVTLSFNMPVTLHCYNYRLLFYNVHGSI